MPAQSGLPVKTCPVCGTIFQPFRSNHKFCSKKCGYSYRCEGRKSGRVRRQPIASYKENHDRITDINTKARALGLSYGMYKAYLFMGLNPEDFKRNLNLL